MNKEILKKAQKEQVSGLWNGRQNIRFNKSLFTIKGLSSLCDSINYVIFVKHCLQNLKLSFGVWNFYFLSSASIIKILSNKIFCNCLSFPLWLCVYCIKNKLFKVVCQTLKTLSLHYLRWYFIISCGNLVALVKRSITETISLS